MNEADRKYSDLFLYLWERGPLLFFVGSVFLSVVVVGLAMYLENRFDKLESQLPSTPPRSYQAPKHEDFLVAADEVAMLDLPVHQFVYVPAYSHVYRDGGAPFSLETTLSVRNVDANQPLFLRAVEYFDTSGKLVRTFLDETIKLAPLQTVEYLVERRDSSGGSGANFLVQWKGAADLDKPLIETVMVGILGSQAIVFAKSGVEITSP